MSVKTEILSLLQREALTIGQLKERLGVARNAIDVPIRQLLAEGLVRRSDRRERGGIGKPAAFFEAAPGAEDSASGAYQAFLLQLLESLQETLKPAALVDILEKTGRRLAHQAGLSSPPDFERGLRAAMAAADRLGASTEAIAEGGGVLVRNYACPVARAVRREPCVCNAMAAFFSEATGVPAVAACDRGERLICQYRLKHPSAKARRKR